VFSPISSHEASSIMPFAPEIPFSFDNDQSVTRGRYVTSNDEKGNIMRFLLLFSSCFMFVCVTVSTIL
jgi:hypothetical protein